MFTETAGTNGVRRGRVLISCRVGETLTPSAVRLSKTVSYALSMAPNATPRNDPSYLEPKTGIVVATCLVCGLTYWPMDNGQALHDRHFHDVEA